MSLCPVGTGPLSRRTDTLFTPASKEDRSFYLSIYLSIYLVNPNIVNIGIHNLSSSLLACLSYPHLHFYSYTHNHNLIHTHIHILSHILTLTHTLSHILIHTLTLILTHIHCHSHSQTHSHSYFHILTHTHTHFQSHTHSHSHTHTHSYTLTLTFSLSHETLIINPNIKDHIYEFYFKFHEPEGERMGVKFFFFSKVTSWI
jgi:hypothetical protein